METDTYSLAAQAEDEHWWYRGRRAVLKSVLDRYVPTSCRPLNVLEIGCGNGGNLPLLASYGKVFAVELNDAARERAARRGLAQIEKGWLPDGLPFESERFDVIAALDVIEHVENDRQAIVALGNRLTSNGLLLMTIPAYGWLWSPLDEISHHKRRYTSAQLVSLLTDLGFRVCYSSYFNTLLFPFAVTKIALGKLFDLSPCRALRTPPTPMNRLLQAVLIVESTLIPRVSFPYGLSILICASAK